AFSRRLATVSSAADIYRAIEEHLANLVQRKVVLFGAGADGSPKPEQDGLTPRVHAAIADVAAGHVPATTVEAGATWLSRRRSPRTNGSLRSPAWCATRPSGSTTTSRTCSTRPASAASRSGRGRNGSSLRTSSIRRSSAGAANSPATA